MSSGSALSRRRRAHSRRGAGLKRCSQALARRSRPQCRLIDLVDMSRCIGVQRWRCTQTSCAQFLLVSVCVLLVLSWGKGGGGRVVQQRKCCYSSPRRRSRVAMQGQGKSGKSPRRGGWGGWAALMAASESANTEDCGLCKAKHQQRKKGDGYVQGRVGDRRGRKGREEEAGGRVKKEGSQPRVLLQLLHAPPDKAVGLLVACTSR